MVLSIRAARARYSATRRCSSLREKHMLCDAVRHQGIANLEVEPSKWDRSAREPLRNTRSGGPKGARWAGPRRDVHRRGVERCVLALCLHVALSGRLIRSRVGAGFRRCLRGASARRRIGRRALCQCGSGRHERCGRWRLASGHGRGCEDGHGGRRGFSGRRKRRGCRGG